MGLWIDVRQLREWTVICPRGELDIGSVPDFRMQTRAALSAVQGGVAVDLGGLDFVDPAGAVELLGLGRSAAALGHRYTIVCEHGRVRDVLDLTGVSTVCPVAGSLREAVLPTSPVST